ncbi:MAG: hypothetical protein ABSG14_08375 [Verrucomicrobiia bacterium]
MNQDKLSTWVIGMVFDILSVGETATVQALAKALSEVPAVKDAGVTVEQLEKTLRLIAKPVEQTRRLTREGDALAVISVDDLRARGVLKFWTDCVNDCLLDGEGKRTPVDAKTRARAADNIARAHRGKPPRD